MGLTFSHGHGSGLETPELRLPWGFSGCAHPRHGRARTRTDVQPPTCTCAHAYTHPTTTCAHTCMYIHVCVHTCKHTHSHTAPETPTHVRTHTCMDTHTQRRGVTPGTALAALLGSGPQLQPPRP